MINLTDAQKAIFTAGTTICEWRFSIYSGDELICTIPTSQMVSGSLSITESLSSADSLDIGACDAAVLTVQVASNDTPDFYGKKLVVTLAASGNGYPALVDTAKVNLSAVDDDDDTTVSIPMGVFYIDEVTRQNNSWFYTLTAYDAMSLFDVDVAEWYEGLTLPMTIADIRASLCDYIGVEEENVSLPNDNVSIDKTVLASELSGRDVLKAICAINGCFGHATREGKMNYIYLGDTAVVALTKGGDDFYQTTSTHESWTVPAIDTVTVAPDTDSVGGTYPDTVTDESNVLRIENSMFAYGKDTDELHEIAAAIYDKVVGKPYVVHNTLTRGRPWIEVGDKINIETDDETIETYVLKRTFAGFQGSEDTYEASGSEDATNTINDINSLITTLNNRSNTLTRTVDETVSTIAAVKSTLESDYSTTEETESLIQQTSDSILQSVASTYATTAYVDEGDAATLAAAETAATTADATILSTAKSYADSAVSTFEASVASTYATTSAVASIQEYVETISVGGTQLLRGTNTVTTLTSTGTWANGTWRSASGGTGTRTSIEVSDAPNANIKVGWTLTSTSGAVDIAQDSITVTEGQTYTLSCYARGTGSLRMQYGKGTYSSTTTVLDGVSEWTRYSRTFTVSSTYMSSGLTNIYFGAAATTDGIDICGMKLETGTMSTDWSPAPEDTDDAIAAAIATFSQTISTTYPTTEDMDSAISSANESILASAKSYADSAVSSLESSISATYATTSAVASIEQYVSAISVGGRNYLLNTKSLSSAAGKTVFSSSFVLTEDDDGYGVLTVTGTGGWLYINCFTGVDASGDAWAGQKMVVSADIKADDLATTPSHYMVSFSIWGSNNGTSWTRQYTADSRLSSTTSLMSFNNDDFADNEWVRLTGTFTAPAMSDMSEMSTNEYTYSVYVIQFFSASSNSTGTVSIRKPKLEMGTLATDWSPAPEDANDAIDDAVSALSLSVSTTTSGKASIVLTAGDTSLATASGIVTEARTAFENENTSITISAGVITFNGGHIVINSDDFTLDSSGNATFSGTLSAASGSFSGTITAAGGTIGGWTITSSALYSGCSSPTSTTAGTYIGKTNFRQYASSSAYVNIASGVITAVGADITATSGSLSTSLQAGAVRAYVDSTYVGSLGLVSSSSGYYYSLLGSDDDTVGVSIGVKGDNGATGYYFMNCGGNPNGYSQRHQFVGTACFTDNVMFYSSATISSGLDVVGATTMMSLSASSSVSVGTTLKVTGATTLSSTLTVSSTSTFKGNVTVGTTSDTVERDVFVYNSYGKMNLAVSDAGNMGLYDASHTSWIVRHDSSGNLYLATPSGGTATVTSTNFAVTSAGAATFSSTLTALGGVYVGTSASSVYQALAAGSGSITVGTTTYATYIYGASIRVGDASHVTNIYGSTINANTSITVTSDRRMKHDIVAMDDRYTSLIDYIDAKAFKYNEYRPDISNAGFIAQDVLAAMDSVGLSGEDFGAVHDVYNDGSEYSLDYVQFIPIMWELIRQQKREIAELKEQLGKD